MSRENRQRRRAAQHQARRDAKRTGRQSRAAKQYFDSLIPTWDHQRKLARAFEIMHQLGREGELWLEKKPIELLEEIDQERGLRVVFAEVRSPPPVKWSLLISEFLQATRSSLDLLVYELAETHSGRPLPSKVARDCEFPVTSEEFGTSAERKVAAIEPRAASVIRAVQPSKLGDANPSNLLWLLHELARLDRHRKLHVVAAAQQSADLPIPVGGGPERFSMSINAIIDKRTEIASYSLSYPSRLPIGLEIAAAFARDSPIPGVPIGVALPNILRFVVPRLVQPLERYLPNDER